MIRSISRLVAPSSIIPLVHCSSIPLFSPVPLLLCSSVPLFLFLRSTVPVTLFLWSTVPVPLFLFLCCSVPLFLFHCSCSSVPVPLFLRSTVPVPLFHCFSDPLFLCSTVPCPCSSGALHLAQSLSECEAKTRSKLPPVRRSGFTSMCMYDRFSFETMTARCRHSLHVGTAVRGITVTEFHFVKPEGWSWLSLVRPSNEKKIDKKQAVSGQIFRAECDFADCYLLTSPANINITRLATTSRCFVGVSCCWL